MNPASEHIPVSRANGVTGIIEMPEGDLISGQMSLVHLDDSGNNQSMTVVPSAAIHLRFPALIIHPVRPTENDDADDDPAAPEPIPYDVAKKDYDDKMAALLQFFDDARQYRTEKLAHAAGFETNLRFEAMIPVLEGRTPLFVTAVREREIREAIEFSDKQKVKIILADPYECYKVIPEIKAHNIPVVLGLRCRCPSIPTTPTTAPLPRRLSCRRRASSSPSPASARGNLAICLFRPPPRYPSASRMTTLTAPFR